MLEKLPRRDGGNEKRKNCRVTLFSQSVQILPGPFIFMALYVLFSGKNGGDDFPDCSRYFPMNSPRVI